MIDNGDNGSGGSTGASCPLGAPTFAFRLASSATWIDGGQLSVDADGNVVFAVEENGSGRVNVLNASGQAMLDEQISAPIVAVEANGAIFVAGSFSQPITLGRFSLVPQGNTDVFLAKLDLKGEVMFAKALGACGDGILHIAVDAKTGRVAISGASMGTVVVSTAGDVLFQLDVAGSGLAFDSRGDLVVAGEIDQPGMPATAFVRVVDQTGNVVLDHEIAASAGAFATFRAVAIDANDHIVLVGATNGTIDLFGVTISARFAQETGRVSGGFLAEIDLTCNLVFARDLGIVEANGVAIDINGRIVINGATAGNVGPDRNLVLLILNSAGNLLNFRENFYGTGIGRGFAVTTDACGSIFANVDAYSFAVPFTKTPVVLKLAP